MRTKHNVHPMNMSTTGEYVVSDFTFESIKMVVMLLKSAKRCLRRVQPKAGGRWRVTKPRLAALAMTS